MQYDVFISHSSHDKEEVARPLAQALQARGLHVWLDEEQLYVGDSIRRGIDNALRDSRFGVVILSPAYLESEWGQKELDAFFAKEKYQNKSILPIYHGVDVEDVERHWMTLADKISLRTTESIDSLADKIQQSIQRSSDTSVSPVPVKKKLAWWPSNNWQWLIGVLAACVIGVLPFVVPSQPTSQNKIAGGTFHGSVTQIGTQINNSQVDEEALAKRLLSGMKNIQQESLQEKEKEIKQLEATIQNLKNQPFDELKQSALKKLEENKPAEASELLEQSLAKRSEVMSKDWVDVGNIAYLTDSQKALDAYQKAIAINPDNIVAWNQLGLIYKRLGRLDKAAEAYNHVLELAGADESLQAAAYGNLGTIYQTRGELDKAEEYHLKALKIDKALGRQEGIAPDYGNLGLIYRTRGELDKAEEFLLKSLKINEALGRREGMAKQYGNLGLIYGTRGELGRACQYWKKSVAIFKKIGSAKERQVQSWIDEYCSETQ